MTGVILRYMVAEAFKNTKCNVSVKGIGTSEKFGIYLKPEELVTIVIPFEAAYLKDLTSKMVEDTINHAMVYCTALNSIDWEKLNSSPEEVQVETKSWDERISL